MLKLKSFKHFLTIQKLFIKLNYFKILVKL